MKSKKEATSINIRHLKRVTGNILTRTIPLLCLLLALPVAAWADDDDKPIPIDPKTAAMQNRIIGVVVLLVCLAIGWYYLRRWQIMRGGGTSGGSERDD
jgi:hypothetical protein